MQSEHSQLLKVIDDTGRVIYRVQLPREGRTIFLGWEPSGAALAAVQDHGGAFLWFPSKPDCVQQWEGMQFSSQMLRSSALKRNSHFDTCFASWSETRKLVLGLADGNFACWDLQSNETFISRKHFAGKHKSAVTCGAWGMGGQILALGSKNQLKVSAPLLNASWESTAAKLALPDNELSFQELFFSPSGQTLSALAGTSIFRHLCLYSVRFDEQSAGKKSSRKSSSSSESEDRQVLSPLGEMRPDATIGGIQAVVWLENEMVAVVTSNGYLRLLQYAPGEGMLVEDQHKPASSGVTAATLCKKTGHIAIVNPSLITFFDPLMLEVTATVGIPTPPDGVRHGKLQMCPSGNLLILGRTDGVILRIPIPDMPKSDLTLLTVRRRANSDMETVGQGSNGSQGGSNNHGVLCASCGTPNLVASMSAADGASSGYGHKLHHAWSQMRGLLAVVNARNEVIVIQRSSDGSTQQLLREQLPEANIVSAAWDPSTQSVLAIAIRHYGIALWDSKGNSGVQMWSGMSYKSMFMPLRKSTKAFDPIWSSWNLAGQLAVGMQDGTFAVWDSMSMDISTSQSSGKHKGPITAGDWFSSLFAPALALASRSTIKVSQGFEGVEWSATAMKLKVGKEPSFTSPTPSTPTARLSRQLSNVAVKTAEKAKRLSTSGTPSRASNDLEGLDFEKLMFSPSGRHLATIAQPTGGGNKQVVVYELQDNRRAMMATREVNFNDGDVPFGISWLIDNQLLVFIRSSAGDLSIKMVSPTVAMMSMTWPTMGTKLPGSVVDCQASAQGLVAVALTTPDQKGMLMIVTCPRMTVVAEMPLEGKPQSILLYQPKGSYVAYLTIAFEGGGVEAWELPPADQTVELM